MESASEGAVKGSVRGYLLFAYPTDPKSNAPTMVWGRFSASTAVKAIEGWVPVSKEATGAMTGVALLMTSGKLAEVRDNARKFSQRPDEYKYLSVPSWEPEVVKA